MSQPPHPSPLSNPSKRLVWLDFTRLIAMFSVVCCHCCDPFNFCPEPLPPNIEEIKLWGAIWGAALRPCVPLFVMITGALLLPIKDDTFPFYRKRIGRVFWPFLIWSIIYALFPWLTGVLGQSPQFILHFFPYSGEEAMRQSLQVSLDYIAQIPFNFSPIAVHAWYIYLLIGLYLYMPIFSAWVERASERGKIYFLGAWAVTTLLPYYFEYVSPYVWGSCSWNNFHMLYYFAGFNGYLLLGHWLRHHEQPTVRILLWGIPAFIVGWAVTFFGFRHVTALPDCPPELLELFFTYNSLNVVLMTAPIFMLCQKVHIKSPRMRRLLANLTTCGFGIYMVHYFLTGPCVELMRLAGIPIALQIPLAAVAAFALTWALVDLLRRSSGRYARYIIG